MKDYDYAHQTNRPQPLSAAPRAPAAGRKLCPVYRKAEHNTAAQRAARVAHRKAGTWCSPLYRRPNGSSYYHVHHSGPKAGSVSELEVKRASR